MTTIKKITVAGSGVLGSQIAFQSALHGYDVTIYDINGEAIEKSKKLIDTFLPRYKSDLQISSEKLEEAYPRCRGFIIRDLSTTLPLRKFFNFQQ